MSRSSKTGAAQIKRVKQSANCVFWLRDWDEDMHG